MKEERNLAPWQWPEAQWRRIGARNLVVGAAAAISVMQFYGYKARMPPWWPSPEAEVRAAFVDLVFGAAFEKTR